jgi:hypothetical protein
VIGRITRRTFAFALVALAACLGPLGNLRLLGPERQQSPAGPRDLRLSCSGVRRLFWHTVGTLMGKKREKTGTGLVLGSSPSGPASKPIIYGTNGRLALSSVDAQVSRGQSDGTAVEGSRHGERVTRLWFLAAWTRKSSFFNTDDLTPANMKRNLLIFALLVVIAPSHAARASDKPVPSRVEVKYRMSVAGVPIGEGLEIFQHDGKTYSLVSESRTIGIAAIYRLHIRREAKGDVTAKGLRPLSFVETRNGRFTRSARFDWAAGQVQLTDGDKKQTVQLPPNTWDAASLAWTFAFWRPDGKSVQVYMTDGRRLTEYKYSVLGREKLATPLGELYTVHVKKIQEEGDKRALDAWLAIDQLFLLARVRGTEKDGTVFDSMVQSVNLVP